MGRSPLVRQVAGVLALAASYWIAGRLGLLLAIPPGYATAVWPASGVALAFVLLGGVRLWPGVWLGSFLVNVWTDPGVAPAASWDSVVSAAAIAGGAALQAVVGAVLVRRFVPHVQPLTLELGVVKLLLLGGPVACLIAATTGVTALWQMGAIAPDEAAINWWTWWIGDSVGVLVFAPLVLVWAARPHALWLRRQLYVTVPLAAMFAAVVLLYLHASRREQLRILGDFDDAGLAFAQEMRRNADFFVEAVNQIESFIAASSDVSADEFQRFAQRLVQVAPGPLGVAWSPHVAARDRRAFEAAQRARGLDGFSVRERAADGTLVPAPVRDRYFPIVYVAPFEEGSPMLGFDTASEASRAAALAEALDTGRPVATSTLQLAPNRRSDSGFLILKVVRRAAGEPLGVVSAAYRINDLVESSLWTLPDDRLVVRVLEVKQDARRLLYGPAELAPGAGAMRRTIPFAMAGSAWELDLTLPGVVLLADRSWQTWTVLAAGMLFTGLLGMFLLVVIGRSASIEHIIAVRTAELESSNRALLHETERRQEAEIEVRERADQLAASNRELEQFAYVASHDLQAPLRTIAGFVGLLDRRYKNKLDEQANEFIQAVLGGVSEMQALIQQLLQLSRVNGERMQMDRVPLRQTLDRALDALASDLAATGAKVECDELPEVQADRRLLTQLFQNLVANAIKFQPKSGARPQVRISARRKGSDWHLSVSDNGIGIPADQMKQLFLMFKRLHRHEDYAGSGIGLALCKKIVQLHRGRIWAESEPGKGTTIHFTLPAIPAVLAEAA